MGMMKLGAMERTKQLAAGTWRDTRYALRGMRKRPGFAVLAIATLALGIGVNTTSVAVAHSILVRPLASLVYGVSPYDAATFAGTAIAIAGGCRAHDVRGCAAGALRGSARRPRAGVSGSFSE
jgi:hypothetical protein